MKIAAVFVVVGVLAAFVCESNAQSAVGGPGFGWADNAVQWAIDGALAKADPAEFPPELQVSTHYRMWWFSAKRTNITRIIDFFCVHRRNCNKFWKISNWDWPLATIQLPQRAFGAVKSVNTRNCRNSKDVWMIWNWKLLLLQHQRQLLQLHQILNQMVNQMMNPLLPPNKLNSMIRWHRSTRTARIIHINIRRIRLHFKGSDDKCARIICSFYQPVNAIPNLYVIQSNSKSIKYPFSLEANQSKMFSIQLAHNSVPSLPQPLDLSFV